MWVVITGVEGFSIAVDRVDLDDPASRLPEADGGLHPRVRGHDEPRAGGARHRDRNPRQPVLPRREPVPAVEVDAEEDRLDEERERLQGERQPDHRAPAAHQSRPKSPSAKDRTVPDTAPTANSTAERLRPSPRERHPRRVAGSVPRGTPRSAAGAEGPPPAPRRRCGTRGRPPSDPCGLEGRKRQNHPLSMLAERPCSREGIPHPLALGHPGVDTPRHSADTDRAMKSARTIPSNVLVLIR